MNLDNMLAGIRILRFDAASGTVAVRYRVEANVWRLLYIPYDELKALIGNDEAFPI